MGFPHNVPARLCATQVSNIKSNIDFKATQEFYLDLKSTLISIKQFWHKTTLILRQLKIFTLIFLLDWWNIFFNFVHIIKMDRNLIPISAKQFREVSKGCGIKYRNKIPSKELKSDARLSSFGQETEGRSEPWNGVLKNIWHNNGGGKRF